MDCAHGTTHGSFLQSYIDTLCTKKSTRRPLKASAAKHMKMQMSHGLTAVASDICYKAIAVFGDTVLFGDFAAATKTCPAMSILSSLISNDDEMCCFRNYKHVKGRLGFDIVKRIHKFVLIDLFAWYFAVYYFAE